MVWLGTIVGFCFDCCSLLRCLWFVNSVVVGRRLVCCMLYKCSCCLSCVVCCVCCWFCMFGWEFGLLFIVVGSLVVCWPGFVWAGWFGGACWRIAALFSFDWFGGWV